MERMRGRAWAESSPSQGATFYLEIPHGTHRDLESNEATEQTNPPTNVDEVIRPKQAESVTSELSIQKKS